MSSFFLPPPHPVSKASKALPSRTRKTIVSRQPATPALAAPSTAADPPTAHQMAPALDPVLRLPKVCDLTGCAKSTWLRYVKDGLAPRGIRLGPNTVGWFQSSIVAWLQSRPQA